MTTTSDSLDSIAAAFAALERNLNGSAGHPVHALRRQAMASFQATGFPSRRDEEWRYTSIGPIAATRFAPPAPDAVPVPTRSALAPYLFDAVPGPQLVFVDGLLAPALSRLDAAAGLTVGPLAAALESGDPQVAAHLARHATYEREPFTALNTAFIQDGAYVRVAAGAPGTAPVQVLFVSTAAAAATVTHPRLLVIAEDGARLTVLESFAGLGPGPYLTNAVGEILLRPGAQVDHYRIQREGAAAFHISDLRVKEARDARFRSTCITLGGRLTRNHVHTELQDEGIDSTLNGLYLTAGEQHVDNHTLIEHQAPHCSSHEYYKGVLDGSSTGVFRGKILVHRQAQKTDAYQANRNLLLAPTADINTKPQLEIYADDVKCSHGATIGQLDPDALFYLRSRGVGLQEARRVLTEAFAAEIVARIQVEEVCARLGQLVAAQLAGGPT